MRRLIAGMQISVDGKIEGPDQIADWIEDWSDGYDVMNEVDALVLGAGMYPGYEAYWEAISSAPEAPLEMVGGRAATPEEIDYAAFAKRTPHYVLSSTLTSAVWSETRFLREVAEVEALKLQQGKDIHLVGGARTVASLIDHGLVDELRLMLHPLIVGQGKPLFENNLPRHPLRLVDAQTQADGRVLLTYRFGWAGR